MLCPVALQVRRQVVDFRRLPPSLQALDLYHPTSTQSPLVAGVVLLRLRHGAGDTLAPGIEALGVEQTRARTTGDTDAAEVVGV